MEYYAAEKIKELLLFTMTWIKLESIVLSDISQVVEDKYHMVSSIGGTESTQRTSEQNITRDMEIRNKLTVTEKWEEQDNRIKKGKS